MTELVLYVLAVAIALVTWSYLLRRAILAKTRHITLGENGVVLELINMRIRSASIAVVMCVLLVSLPVSYITISNIETRAELGSIIIILFAITFAVKGLVNTRDLVHVEHMIRFNLTHHDELTH